MDKGATELTQSLFGSHLETKNVKCIEWHGDMKTQSN